MGLFKGITTSGTVRHSARLLSANLISQAIALLVYPFITRLYTPADFGLFQLFMSIGGVLVILSTLDYQYAVVLPRVKKESAACFHVSFAALLFFTALCCLSVPFRGVIAGLFNTPELADYYAWMPLYVFALAFWVLLSYWYTSRKEFSKLAIYQLVQSGLSSGWKYAFGLWAMPSGLIVSTVLAPVVAIATTVIGGFRRVFYPLFRPDRVAMREAAVRHSNFPKYSLPRTLINSFNCNMPILLLVPFFGTAQVGFLGMALTLAFRPVNMVASSLYQVFFQQTSERVNAGRPIWAIYKRYFAVMFGAGVPGFGLLYFVLPMAVRLLLGPGWEQTAELIRVMLPWLLLGLVVSPIYYVVDVFREQRMSMCLEIGAVGVLLGALLLGVWLDDFVVAVALFSWTKVAYDSVLLVWYVSLVRRYERGLVESE